MEFSQFTDYSLRVLLYLAVKGEGLSSIKEISDAYSISNNHLVKVVHNLSKLGLVETFRGRSGGITLAKSPEELVVGELVRKTENLAILECFPGGKGTCCIIGICRLQGVLKKALDAFLAELDKVTVADMVGNRAGLGERLGIAQPVP